MKNTLKTLLFFEKWLNPSPGRKRLAFIGIVILMALSGMFVYLTGGIKFVYSHTMYVPIILSAFFFGIPGGVAAAIVGGIVLGPFMPVDITTGEMQTTINWIYRIAIFVINGFFMGLFVQILKRYQNETFMFAYHHQDTGLPNLKYLLIGLEKEIVRRKNDKHISLFLLHLKNYPEIEYMLGPEKTNQIICDIASQMEEMIFSNSVYYIDPYILAGFRITDDYSQENHNMIKNLFERYNRPLKIGDTEVFPEICIGESHQIINKTDPIHILGDAKFATNLASQRGMDYYVHPEELDDQSNIESPLLLASLMNALENEELQLYYQPILDIKSDKIYSLEALIRWLHPKQGIISPNAFIPQLESSSLVHKIQDWIIRSAIADRENCTFCNYDFNVSINLSSKIFYDQERLAVFEDLFASNDHHDQPYILEITETVAMQNPKIAIDFFNKVKQHGVKIALDDFGKGYSSLGYLKSMPIDDIKIDMDLIQDITTRKGDRDLVEMIIKMSHDLGFKVVAEGVEEQETLDILKELGCDYAQGFLFSKARPLCEIKDWVKDREKEAV